MKNIALIGAGGHCKVIIDLIHSLNQYNIVGIYDDYKSNMFCNYQILGTLDELDETIDSYIIAIGKDSVRQDIFQKHRTLNWVTLIHPSAIVSPNVIIDVGTVVCAGCIIQTDVKIGIHCIINTGCSIDHECTIGDFSSISPKATLCGNVSIGQRCFIGANATIIPNIQVNDNSTIGAGSVIIRHVGYNEIIVGNPGKYLNNNSI